MLDFLAARFNLPRLVRSQRGLTTVEYAVAGSLIVIVMVAGLTLIGTKASSALTTVGSSIK